MKRIIEYFSVITIGVFFIAFAYLYGYYQVFGIDITSYITTTEVFYTILPLAINFILLPFFFTGVLLNFIWKKPSEKDPGLKEVKKWYEKTWFRILLALVCLIMYLYKDSFGNRFGPTWWLCATILFFASLIYLNFDPQRLSYPIFIAVVFTILSGSSQGYGTKTATVNLSIGNRTNVTFRYHGNLYNSDTTLIFVGQTQSTIFIYNKHNKSNWVLPRSTIDSLVFHLQ